MSDVVNALTHDRIKGILLRQWIDGCFIAIIKIVR